MPQSVKLWKEKQEESKYPGYASILQKESNERHRSLERDAMKSI